MAVSKTQNERPAITNLIDAVNMAEPIVAQNVQNIATLTEGLADEIGDREAAVQAEATARLEADTMLTNSLGATNAQVLELTNDVDQLEQETVPALQAFVNRFRTGLTESFTIQASSSQAGSVTFNTPYAGTAKICVFLCCVDEGEIFTNLECQLISATYSGFSYNIVNTDTTDAHTIAVGFVAVQVN